MKISVIIPTLNEETVLPATLDRTLSLPFDEVIVVDGGSRDRTPAVVSAFQSRSSSVAADEPAGAAPRAPRLLFISAPAGRGTQMNAGADRSRGEILLFLHADTRLPPDAHDAIVHALTETDCVGGRFDVRFDPDAGWGWVISRMMNLRSRLTGIATGDQAMFVRRAVFERLGGFAGIPIMEDIEFSRRLKHVGRTAALHQTVTTSYRRWRRNGPLRTIVLMWGLRFLYWAGINPRRLHSLYGPIR
jgi:rSAM/selenodomain-associated transferase 2